MLDKWMKKHWTRWHDMVIVGVAAILIAIGLLAITTSPAQSKHWESRHLGKSYTTVTPNRYLFREDGSNRRQSRTDTHNRKFLESTKSRRSLSRFCSTDTFRDGIPRLNRICDNR